MLDKILQWALVDHYPTTVAIVGLFYATLIYISDGGTE